MVVTASIMAHESRADMARKLMFDLGKSEMARIILDSITLSIQKGEANRENEWKNGRECLLKGVDSDWHVVLQDDAVIGPNFLQNAYGSITQSPEKTLISFYLGTGTPYPITVETSLRKAHASSWLSHYSLLWGVGFAVPGSMIRDIVEFCDGLPEKVEYDRKIGEYFRNQGKRVLYTNPSIIDHLDGDTLLGRRKNVIRKAHRYEEGIIGTFNQSVTEIK